MILKSLIHWEHPKACATQKTITIFVYWRDIAPTTLSRSQPLLNMNIEGNFEVSLWRHRRRHHHGKYVFYWHFQNDCHFEAIHFYCKRYQKLDIPARQPWTFSTFWVFHRSCKQISRDMGYVSSKFRFILGSDDVINDVMNTNSYRYNQNPMHWRDNIEGWLWAHPVTSSVTSSQWKKYFFWHTLERYLYV